MMLKATRPECFVPIHGEFRHLSEHARLAESAGVPKKNTLVVEDGQEIELTQESISLGVKWELRKGAIVEGQFMESDPLVFAQRNQLSRTGIVFVSFVRNAKSLRLVEAPRVACHGILFREGIHAEDVPLDAADLLEDLYPDIARREDWKEVVKIEMRRFFRKRASHKPVVVSVMQDV
jgi:ribonuclease J